MAVPNKDVVLKLFEPVKTAGFRVRVNGKFVLLHGHSKVYRTIGTAKCAISSHLWHRLPYDAALDDDDDETGRRYVMDNWVGIGAEFPIEIVPV